MDTALSVIASLLGVLVGASLARRAADSQRRLNFTFDLHREYNSSDMIRARHAAAELLRGHPGLDYRDLRDQLGYSGAADLDQVIYFFQRLWLAVEYGAVQEKYVSRLFGDSFSWWYELTFRAMLVPTATEMGADIDALQRWMVDHSTEEQRQSWRGANLDVWRRRDTGTS